MLFDSGCVVCGDRTGPVCAGCTSDLVVVSGLRVGATDVCRAAFRLNDPARTVIAALKYHKQRRVANWLGEQMAHLVPRGADVLTWVPATPQRRRTRGFDQAQELARALSRYTGVPSVKLLRRATSDQRQTGLNRTERAAGPTLAAQVAAPPMVVIVDDVLTTGSSMTTAARVLRSASAQRIVGLVAAITPPPGEQSLRRLTEGSIVRGWT